MAAPRDGRRSQAERSAGTRKALVDATVASLVERGYARTTTTNVVRDAGVSLGALSHHFASKTELMTATVAHLLERRQQEFRDQVSTVGAGPERLVTAIDALWAAYSGPTFAAWLELWVGGLRDPELAPAVLRMQEEFMASSRALFRELFPPEQYAGAGLDERSMALALTVMEGVALKAVAGVPADTTPIDVLKALARRNDGVRPPDQPSSSRVRARGTPGR